MLGVDGCGGRADGSWSQKQYSKGQKGAQLPINTGCLSLTSHISVT